MRRVAVFVDAGYFWVQVSWLLHGSKQQRETIKLNYDKLREILLEEVRSQFLGVDFLRVYWYDGPGARMAKLSCHKAIEDLDDFKLRLGTRNNQGQQKAVDGLVLADMISLAQSKAISDALLISGDGDMVPGVVAAQAMGLRVHLLSIGTLTATSPYLTAEADKKTIWDKATVDLFAEPLPLSPATPVVTLANVVQAASVQDTSQVPVAAPVDQNASPVPVSPPYVDNDSTNSANLNNVPELSIASASAVLAASFDSDSMVATVHAIVMNGDLASLLSQQYSMHSGIPAKVDSLLLREGKKALSRPLTEEEKRELRRKFKMLVIQNQSALATSETP